MSPARPRVPERLAGLLIAVGVLTFVGAIVWAVSAPGLVYSWRDSMISDLGALTCLATDGRWICSPRHAAFNAAQACSGALFLAGAALTARRDHHLTAGVACTGLGLMLLAVFPSDAALGPHMIAAVVALPVSTAFLLVHALRSSGRYRRVRIGLTAAGLSATIVHLIPDAVLQGAAELLSVAASCLTLFLVAVDLVLPARPVERPAHAPR